MSVEVRDRKALSGADPRPHMIAHRNARRRAENRGRTAPAARATIVCMVIEAFELCFSSSRVGQIGPCSSR